MVAGRGKVVAGRAREDDGADLDLDADDVEQVARLW
jgi:hypothetical protein